MRADTPARVYAATSSNLNFQARLQSNTGAIVSDGNYHIEFKLYSVSSGGSALWTETRTTGNLVRVVNGYFTVDLGSVTAFPSTISWDQEHWLTMNVGGSGGSPSFDGEMTPRLKLTAVPYAFRSGVADALKNGAGSLTASDLLHKAPAAIQNVNSTVAGLRIDQTGTGGLLQLQGTGADVFTIDKVGNTYAKGSLDVDGALTAGGGNAFSVNTFGDITSAFTALNGISAANGGTLIASTSLVLTDATNFDVGNYVQVNSANCGGTGINPCYAKITAKATNTLTITPALIWASGSTVNEYHVPELGGTDTAQNLANRYGRGYFIAGVATGNGTTYYNENSIETSLTTFDLVNTGVTTLNIGGAATTITIGNSNTDVNILGSLQTSAAETITAGGGLIVSSGGAVITGGIDNNSGGITEAGALSGITTLSLSGAITGATTANTINGLVINSGALSNISTINASGLITSVGLTAGTGLIQGTGGLTIVGATSIDGALFDPTGNLLLNDITDIGSVTTGLQIGTDGSLLDIDGSLVLNDQVLLGSATTGLQITTAGTITDIDGVSVVFGENVTVSSGGITATGNSTITGTLTGLTGLTVASGGASITGAINNNDGGITNAGTIAGTTYIDLKNNVANPTYTEGRLFYDNTQKALSYYNSESAITMNIGQENYIYVRNDTGATINDGQAVYINGSSAGVPTIALSQADNSTTASAVGVATHSIETGTFGYVTNFGEINNLNTSGFTSGDNLYVSGVTAGLLTNVRPAQPNYTVPVARVTEVNAATGKILVIVGAQRNGLATTGAVAFGASDGSLINDTALFWDNTNKRLGIGDATPLATLTVGNGDLFQVAGATGALTTSGLITGTAGLTITGAAVSFNVGSNFATNINTGTSTGTVTIGGGTTPLVINSTAFDVSATGALSGITTLTASGNIAISNTSVYQQNSLSGVSVATCANDQYIGNGVRISGGITTNGTCRSDANTLSDTTLKKNIVELGSTLDSLKGLKVYTYDFKCDDPAYANLYLSCEKQTGILAQELETIFPALVTTRPDGLKEVNLRALNFYNLKAVSELAQKLDSQGNADLNTVKTGGVLRLSAAGGLSNITGLNVISGGASINGGINNNSGGITNIGSIAGATTINASGNITTTGNININGAGIYQIDGINGSSISCGNNNLRGTFTGGIATSLSCAGLSDGRLKENVVGLDDSVLDKIKDVRTVSFDFKCDDPVFQTISCDSTRQSGVIAQELAQVFPELVYQEKDGYYRVNYEALSVYNLKAVSEIAQHINSKGEANLNTLTVTGVLEAGTIRADHIEGLDYIGRFESLEERVSAMEQKQATATQQESPQQQIDLENLTAGTFTANGSTTLNGTTVIKGEASFDKKVSFAGDVVISGQAEVDKLMVNLDLIAGGTLEVNGAATFKEMARFEKDVNFQGKIAVAGDADFQKLTVNLDLFVKGALFVEGPATFKEMARFEKDVSFEGNVAVKGQATFNSDTAGTVELPAGERVIKVKFSKSRTEIPIITLSLGGGKFAQYSYRNVTKEDFEIVVKTASADPLVFSWIALQAQPKEVTLDSN